MFRIVGGYYRTAPRQNFDSGVAPTIGITKNLSAMKFDAKKTQSLLSYCKDNNISAISQVKNPHTGKIFISFDNGSTAALSTKVTELNATTQISQMADGGLIIHRKGSSSNVLSFTKVSELS